MIVLEEHFADNRNAWHDVREADCTAGVAEGSYTFDHRRDGDSYWLSWVGSAVHDRASFRVHATVERLGGVRDSACGLVWGVRDTSHFHSFLVRPDGQVRVARHRENRVEPLIDWTVVGGARRGPGISLLEMRRKAGGEVEFRVNRALVGSIAHDDVARDATAATGFIVQGRIRASLHALVLADDGTDAPGAPGAKPAKETEASYVLHEPPPGDTYDKAMSELRGLVGLDAIKRQVLRLTHLLQVQQERRRRGLKNAPTSLHMALTGPPGTGKTTVSRLLGRLWKHIGVLSRGHVVETDRAGLVGGYLGQTALKVDHAVRAALDGVLFIDEAHSLVPEQLTYHDYGIEAVHVLLKRMEDHRERLAIVIAGYSKEMERFLAMNPGVRSRFGRQFHFPHFSPDELVAILRLQADDAGYALDHDAEDELRVLFEHAHARRDPAFGNARFVRNLFERTLEQHASRVAAGRESASDEALSLLRGEDVLGAAGH
ncbi:MAG: AAA family ATPase [Polyangiales bacterium]